MTYINKEHNCNIHNCNSHNCNSPEVLVVGRPQSSIILDYTLGMIITWIWMGS